MPHNYNRLAFQGGTTNPATLLALYCSLIDLELALKDHFVIVAWRSGHQVVDWVSELGEAALAVQLSDALSALFTPLPCNATFTSPTSCNAC
jgi:hypothetical protein